MADLPFTITVRATGRSFIMVIARVGDQEITIDRYPLGSAKRRREVAEQWANDPRLCNGTVVNPDDIVARLESLELETKNKIDAEPQVPIDDVDGAIANGDDDGKPAKKSHATQLVDLVKSLSGVELWHTPDGDGYATIPKGAHFENWRINSNKFRQWLSGLFYDDAGKAPGGQALQDAINTLQGDAVHRGREHKVHIRLAEHDGAIYLDLCNEVWEVVRATARGWEVVENPPVKFRRARGMLRLPTPIHGGRIDDLRRFVNVAGNADFILIVAWLIGVFRPTGPYPILELNGEQGSGKSTQARALRQLVDPNEADLRSQPRDERDLVIAANNGWVLGFDNLSAVPPWLSDALCRISTGGGFATRELYTDSDEVIFTGQRPIILNGITELASRSDLLDRAIRVTLPQIPEHKRRPEAEFWADFEKARPAILGALLDALCMALWNIDKVRLDRLPRMADFAKWVVAAEPSLPWKPGAFLTAYAGNRESAHETALDASPVAGAFRTWFDRRQSVEWTGTASDLLTELGEVVGEVARNRQDWPKSGRGLSGVLRRLAPNLRAVGIDVLFDTEGRGNDKRRIIVVRRFGNDIDPTDPTVPSQPGEPGNPDVRGRSSDDRNTSAQPRPSPDTPHFDHDNADGNDGDGGDGRLDGCSNFDDDDSDRGEREAIMAVEAEAEAAAIRANGGAFTA